MNELRHFCDEIYYPRSEPQSKKVIRLLCHFESISQNNPEAPFYCYLVKKILPLLDDNTILEISQSPEVLELLIEKLAAFRFEFDQITLRRVLSRLNSFHIHCKKLFILCKARYLFVKQLEDSNSEGYTQETANFPKSLEILQTFWNDLDADERCFDKNEEFLRLYLDELISTAGKYSTDDLSFKELEAEIRKLLACLYGLEFSDTPDVNPQNSVTYAKLDWSVCEKVLKLFLPKHLVQNRRNQQNNPVLISIINNFLPVIKSPLTTGLKARFNAHLSKHLNYSYSVVNNSWSPKSYKEVLRKLPQAKDVSKQQVELSIKALFILAQDINQQKSCSSYGEFVDTVNCILMLDKSWINNKLLTRLCDIFVESMPKNVYTVFGDEYFKLAAKLINFLSCLILLRKRNVERLHLELAVTMYTLATNIRRFLKSNSTSSKSNELQAKLNDAFSKCKVHFQTASMFEEQDCNVDWVASFFFGKIGEKTGAGLVEIVGHYQKCAHLMEKAGCNMFGLISYSSEEHKCLEVFYRIYRYLDKVRCLAFTSQDSEKLRQVIYCLELFDSNETKRKSSKSSSCFVMDLKSELEQKMSTKCELSLEERNEKAMDLIEDGYLKIEKRGSHYKTIYRQFEYHHLRKRDRDQIANDLFRHFLESEDKSMAPIFVTYSYDYRPYFCRHGSTDFHVKRVFNFVLDNFSEELGPKRLVQFLSDMLFDHKDRCFVKYELTEKRMECLIKKCMHICTIMLDTCIQTKNYNLKDDAEIYLELFEKIGSNLECKESQTAKKFYKIVDYCIQQLRGMPSIQNYAEIAQMQMTPYAFSPSDLSGNLRLLGNPNSKNRRNKSSTPQVNESQNKSPDDFASSSNAVSVTSIIENTSNSPSNNQVQQNDQMETTTPTIVCTNLSPNSNLDVSLPTACPIKIEVDEKESKKQDLKNSIQEEQATIDSLENRKRKHQEELQKMQEEDLLQLRKKQNELETESKNLKEECNKLKLEKDWSKIKLEELMIENERLKRECDELKKEVSGLKDNNAKLQKRSKMLDSFMSNLQKIDEADSEPSSKRSRQD